MTNPDKPGIVENWQVGDLAVCVNAAPICNNGNTHLGGLGCLTVGKIYTVASSGDDPRGPLVWLYEISSGDFLSGGGFLASRFRKIRPDETEACEEEFVTLLKRVTVTA